MNNRLDVVSLHSVFKTYCGTNKDIYWIKSFTTLRNKVKRDLECNNILGTKILKSNKLNTGDRYYIPKKNLNDFIFALKNIDL